MAIDDSPPLAGATSRTAHSAYEIQNWLVKQLAEELQVPPETINVDQPILAHGIDSMHVVAIVAKLEDWLGVRFSSDPLEDYPSIDALSRALARTEENRPPVG